jgi:pilus assembly protein Flp/PilA
MAMQRTLADFVADESGATAIEYALIAGIVSISIVAALTNVSSTLRGSFNNVATNLQTATK